jgi:hypothetical protein
MIDPQELKSELAQFTGTMQWHKWNFLAKNYLLTDGALYLAQKAGAFWLMDLIASYYPKLKGEPFQVWKLTVNDDRSALVVCEDGNLNELTRQEVPFTDFPLDEITLFVGQDEPPYWVILLPSEY